MSAEIRTIEPSRLAAEVSDDFLKLTNDIVKDATFRCRGLQPVDFSELADAAAGDGLSEEAQAHVLEATLYKDRHRSSPDVRSRIAETVGMMKMLRDYYRPSEEGLRVAMDPTNIYRVEVVGTPTVELSLVKDGGAPPFRLRVEAQRLARMASSKDHVEYPAAGTGVVNFWDSRDAFPQSGGSVVNRLAAVAVLGSVENPNADTVHAMSEQYGQAATNLLLAKAGVPVEKLPVIPEDEVTQRRQLLVRRFADRLVALESGIADPKQEPMALDDARFMLSVLESRGPKATSFVEEVRDYIVAEYSRVHRQLTKGVATLDEDFALSKELSVLNAVHVTQFGHNGRFAALFAE